MEIPKILCPSEKNQFEDCGNGFSVADIFHFDRTWFEMLGQTHAEK